MTNKMPQVFHFGRVQIHGHWHILYSNFKEAKVSRLWFILPWLWLLRPTVETRANPETDTAQMPPASFQLMECRWAADSVLAHLKSCRILHRWKFPRSPRGMAWLV